MKWLKLFKKDTKEYPYDETRPLGDRIAEIKSRIAAIRSSYGWDQEPYKNTMSISDYVPTEEFHQHATTRDNDRATKAAELDNLKAKLLKK